MFEKIYPLLLVAILSALFLAACGGSAAAPAASKGDIGSGTTAAGADNDGDGIPDSAEGLLGTDPDNADSDGDGQNDLVDAEPMLTDNPIQENSTAVGFTIGGLLVENNVDANGADVADHLQFKVTNSGTADLTNFDIYTTFTDQTTGDMQSYYRTLSGFTVEAGETKDIHFDNTGQPGHYSVNPNSAYYTNPNGLTVEVTLHTPGFASQTAAVSKDPAGEEGGVE